MCILETYTTILKNMGWRPNAIKYFLYLTSWCWQRRFYRVLLSPKCTGAQTPFPDDHDAHKNKAIKDGGISPWPFDHNCPYNHMEWFDQMEWREHDLWLDQLYGEDGRLAF